VRRSVSAVSAVRQHCVNTNRYNTQHTFYTPCVSIKRTGKNKIDAALYFWRSQQLHSQSANTNSEVHFHVPYSPAIFLILNNTNPTIILCPPVYLTSLLILFSHLPLRPSSGFLPSRYPTKIYNLYFKHVSCSQ
jgi:hypothetical protein